MASGFNELEIWKKAHDLTIKVYELTSLWPKDESHGLTSQICRAAVSVELNIAEGHGRYYYNEIIRFMFNARGSIQEVRNCLMLARDLKLINLDGSDFEKTDVEYVGLIKGVNGFINSLKGKKSN